MVLVDAAIAWRDKKFTERVRKAADRARAGSATDDAVTKAVAEALAKAGAERDQAWRAWLERQEARGVSFDEPPPGVNGHPEPEDARARGAHFDEAPPAP